MTPGVDDKGVLRDPEAYFVHLVSGTEARDYARVLRAIEADLFKYGLGHQCDSSGTPRGRLFLPYAGARDCAPRNERERFLGVRQEPACWECFIDVVDAQPTAWRWIRRTNHEYVPIGAVTQPVPSSEIEKLAKALAEVRGIALQAQASADAASTLAHRTKVDADRRFSELQAEIEAIKATPAGGLDEAGVRRVVRTFRAEGHVWRIPASLPLTDAER